ncbi:hypothetical protein [Methylohalobius crimeensis]|nr:hypothetical protein [Methylohalobius crimeensis]
MILYLDTSAYLKLYVQEAESDFLHADDFVIRRAGDLDEQFSLRATTVFI